MNGLIETYLEKFKLLLLATKNNSFRKLDPM